METWKTFKTTTARCGKHATFTREWQISDHGNVRWYAPHSGRIVPRNTFLTGGRLKSRYYCISINDADEKYVHRLVATHFIDNPDNYDVVNHKDGNKQNNHYTNLEWTDHKGNLMHSNMLKGKLEPKAYLERRRADLERMVESQMRKHRIELHQMLFNYGHSIKGISELTGETTNVVRRDIKK